MKKNFSHCFLGMLCLLMLAACGGSSSPSPSSSSVVEETPPPEEPIVDLEELEYEATIRWTSHGIPRIKAANIASLGYGYGYSLAKENVCEMADIYMTLRAERSRYFGPEGTYFFSGNSSTYKNIDADFFFQHIIDTQKVERLVEQEPPLGPLPEIREGVRGYVAGYNRYLQDVGVDNIPDERCKGEPWVKPITEIDAYRRFYQLALLASSATSIDGIVGAQPPPSLMLDGLGSVLSELLSFLKPLTDAAYSLPDPSVVAKQLSDAFDGIGIGSNAIALGSEATGNGSGMLLGNPHFPWTGGERFFEAQLTIPGEINVSGASLFGVPLILIGHTENLAWSHTVSSAFRFTPVQLTLVPGKPTTYLVDGQPEDMIAHKVTVEVLTESGKLEPRTRTLYETRYGPVVDSLLGLPLFPWTPLTAYAINDANAANFRFVNHFYEANKAQSVDELLAVLKRNQGVPWVNTIAADSQGNALYADISVVPNVPDAHAIACASPLGLVTFPVIGLPVLDGSRSACDWQHDEDALQPGTMGPGRLPYLVRRDYVMNANDSYWLSHPEERLTGYSRIVGNENTPRSLRTRSGFVQIEEHLSENQRFERQHLQDLLFNNRQYAAELWLDELLSICETVPVALGSQGPVSTAEACSVLANWERRDDIESRGALLFRRFVENILLLSLPSGSAASTDVFSLAYTRPFSLSDPVNTPSGLNPLNPLVQAALADAITDLNSAAIPLDAPLGEYQYVTRNGERIPLPGGPGTLGVFNAMNVNWDPERGYVGADHGASFIQVVSFNGTPCPDVRNILAYSQSTNPNSPYYADQTRLFSQKEWVHPPFCEHEIEADTALEIERIGE